MELKTKVEAEEGKHDLLITREFDLSVELLFKAYTEADFVEQWMGTKVLKLENHKHGGFLFETTAPHGKLLFSGSIHDIVYNEKIIRTFEFEGMNHGVQLEYLSFEKVGNEKSKLIIHSIYKSNEHRDEALKMPFAFGLSMAHNKLQEIGNKLN